ncbi:MAG: DUF971 domain-containing protein [Chloroflexota bacterium]
MSDTNATYQNIEPIGVVAEEESQTLLIDWSDGLTTRYPIEWMRWQCPCAVCRGEMGEPGRLSRVKSLSPDEIRLEDVQPIGRYGIMLFWGDGHHDGIYTYNWLRTNSHDANSAELTEI